ncbi:MAG TPA: chemotaxis response regulator protein-glutamate methylesterase [Candidatus Margulisbacteria bacterium]|nr:MAG: hypothetical protein A2X43_07400 [Candidatus Margulisbacteria bacterium GWD2_39_127]OGI03951.1 MAG: hypothetical protein A2X42_10335 [Candidatus Margulisbacteria bacterium GWF2_38_17]OGI08221.1 MAG: hypothetical protein A2X41_00750 [Candidatus Margulisbacteria bacterium GWE2_39_32]HAR61914.1 chemotaxis response regulator protein-glutamate methylesterase [Candidatus Margulisiibacteriota bacterium]HCT85092.1 chemotaxis response regulator protein-glutamate methylesterase [Candidatus Margul
MTYKVLVIDDSRFARKTIASIINKDPLFEVVGIATDGQDALNKLKVITPDIITLDLEMPIMDGITALPEIVKKCQVPILIVSSLSKEGADITINALSLGAADFITKPSGSALEVPVIEKELMKKLKALVNLKTKGDISDKFCFPRDIKIKKDYYPVIEHTSKIVLFGISTGGPSSLARIIPKLSPNLDATFLIVQHMPEHFTKSFAERLDSISELSVKEVEDGDVLRKGAILIARGGSHLTLEQSKNGIIARLNNDDKMNGHKPSVDKMYFSAAKLNVPNKIISIIMTGMGSDGAEGTAAIHTKGGITIAQNEETCIVYGMPKAAVSKGVIDHVAALDDIPILLSKIIQES